MRNLRPEKPRSLAGSLLVAHPNMLDPNFRRAVLFISAHDPDDGAIGVNDAVGRAANADRPGL